MHLGELEKLALNYLWTYGTADAKQVHDYFSPQRGGSLNTVQSALDRLYKKGLLLRTKQGHAFHYQPAMEKKAFLGQLIRSVTDDFSPEPGNLLAAFVSLSAQLDDNSLDKLEALIQQSRQHSRPKNQEQPE